MKKFEEEINIGKLKLKNRLVMAPMDVQKAEGGMPSEDQIAYRSSEKTGVIRTST